MTNGFCNCNECTESNNSLVVDVTLSEVYCPKETRYLPAQVPLQVLHILNSRYCFEAGREPDNYTSERKQLCQVHCTVPSVLYQVHTVLCQGVTCQVQAVVGQVYCAWYMSSSARGPPARPARTCARTS